MAEAIAAFQSELLHKIQFKTSSKVSIDAFLFKSFKFFDLYNNGWLNKTDFFKAIAKCGVVVDTHDMETIFKHYSEGDDRLNYKNFIQNLLFREEEIETNSAKLKASGVSEHNQQRSNNGLKSVGQSRRLQDLEPSQERLKESKIDQIYDRCETFVEIFDCIKKNLRRQGVICLLSLAVQLKSNDIKKTHLIQRNKFKAHFPYLTEDNIETIFTELNAKSYEEINYAEFIYTLKGDLPNQVAKSIEQLFSYLDTKRERQISIKDLIEKNLNKEDLEQFKKCINLYCKFQGIDDGVFTDEDFVDFFGFLSFSYPSNDQFRRFISKSYYGEDDNKSVHSNRSNRSRQFQNKGAEKKQQEVIGNKQDFRKNKSIPIEEVKPNKSQFVQENQQDNDQVQERKSVSRYSELDKKESNTNFVQEVQSIVVRMKKRLATKGTKGFLLFQKAMKSADTDKDTLLNFDEFKQVIKDQRIDITNTECNIVFDVFDEQGTGYVNFPEFMYTLRGKIPENRRVLVEKLWDQLRITEQSTTFAALKHNLNFRSHPDIQNGRRFQDDIFKQIQDTILIIQDLNGTARSQNISKIEFIEYMDNLSLSIIDDKLFESYLLNFWRVNTSADIRNKYAGSRKLFDPTKNGYLMDHHRQAVKGGSVSQNAPFGTSVEPTNYFTEHRKL